MYTFVSSVIDNLTVQLLTYLYMYIHVYTCNLGSLHIPHQYSFLPPHTFPLPSPSFSLPLPIPFPSLSLPPPSPFPLLLPSTSLCLSLPIPSPSLSPLSPPSFLPFLPHPPHTFPSFLTLPLPTHLHHPLALISPPPSHPPHLFPSPPSLPLPPHTYFRSSFLPHTHQMDPPVYSDLARKYGLHVSLLERLYDHEAYDSGVGQLCKTLLTENHRSHQHVTISKSCFWKERKDT